MQGSVLSRRQFSSLLAAATLSFGVLTSAGCVAPGIVVRQASPNPLVGKVEFAIDPVVYPDLMLGDKAEAAYLADKKPDEQQLFAADKVETAKNLIETLTAEVARKGIKVTLANGTPAPFTLRPSISFFEPGSFNGFVNIPSTAKATLLIVDAGGQVIDEIRFQTGVSATIAAASPSARMRIAGTQLGNDIARYLMFRAAPPSK